MQEVSSEAWLNPKGYDKNACASCGNPTFGRINNTTKHCMRCDAFGGDPDDYEPYDDT